MSEYSLPRSGNSPLAFDGELIAESDGQRQFGKEHNRYHEIAVYRTDGGKYVVAIRYHTHWQGEAHHDFAIAVDTASEAADEFRNHEPTSHVGGYPVADNYAEKQQRLLADIRARYDAQVSEILSGEEFAERI